MVRHGRSLALSVAVSVAPTRVCAPKYASSVHEMIFTNATADRVSAPPRGCGPSQPSSPAAALPTGRLPPPAVVPQSRRPLQSQCVPSPGRLCALTQALEGWVGNRPERLPLAPKARGFQSCAPAGIVRLSFLRLRYAGAENEGTT